MLLRGESAGVMGMFLKTVRLMQLTKKSASTVLISS